MCASSSGSIWLAATVAAAVPVEVGVARIATTPLLAGAAVAIGSAAGSSWHSEGAGGGVPPATDTILGASGTATGGGIGPGAGARPRRGQGRSRTWPTSRSCGERTTVRIGEGRAGPDDASGVVAKLYPG